MKLYNTTRGYMLAMNRKKNTLTGKRRNKFEVIGYKKERAEELESIYNSLTNGYDRSI